EQYAIRPGKPNSSVTIGGERSKPPALSALQGRRALGVVDAKARAVESQQAVVRAEPQIAVARAGEEVSTRQRRAVVLHPGRVLNVPDGSDDFLRDETRARGKRRDDNREGTREPVSHATSL